MKSFWECLAKYSDDQPRDDHGRWEGSGGNKIPGLSERATASYMASLSEMSSSNLADHIATLESRVSGISIGGLTAGGRAQHGPNSMNTSAGMLAAARREQANRKKS